ncbi:MAG: Rdx family protein [Chloroflexota bacterium]|nr:Rdx family protein [Chloroflexota bacterium]
MTVAHRVKITYCADCGYEPQTLDLAKALMLEFGARLAGIELIPWEGGTFDVSFDGQLLHSMKRDGGFPQHEAIKDAVRARL